MISISWTKIRSCVPQTKLQHDFFFLILGEGRWLKKNFFRTICHLILCLLLDKFFWEETHIKKQSSFFFVKSVQPCSKKVGKSVTQNPSPPFPNKTKLKARNLLSQQTNIIFYGDLYSWSTVSEYYTNLSKFCFQLLIDYLRWELATGWIEITKV